MKSSLRLAVFVIHTVSMSHFTGLILASCDMPDPMPNTTSILSNQTLSIGSYIIWECSEGYMMQGDTNTVVWVCLEDGTWLGPSPVCKGIECPSPPRAAYSTLDPPMAEAPVVNQTITYTCSNEYTLNGESSNRCVHNGTWENKPPICQRNCDTTNTNIIRFSNLTCFRRHTDTQNWEDSFKLCEGEEEILATVKDAETQTFLVKFLQTFNSENDFWIGAMEGRDWKWRQSDKYIERFFWHEEFPGSGSRDCIELSYQSDAREYTWNPRSRGEDRGVLCQYNDPCQSAGLDQSDMVLEYIGNCFQFLDVSMNCAEGVDECNRLGGFLAEILDESTNTLLADRALYLRQEEIVADNAAWWIGGYDGHSGRSWFWSDKTRVIYEAWSFNEPNTAEDDCIRMRWERNFRWADWDCSAGRLSLCQIGIPACGDPGQPLHGYRLPNDRTTYSVNATLHFTCKEGYRLAGADIVRCMNNGSWDQLRPTCEAVVCQDSPSLVVNASYEMMGSSYQDITVYTCQDGYIPNNEPISFCQQSGAWSTPNFTCTALSPCYSNPCMNGGTCNVNGTSFTCTCPSTYTGLACDEELKPCDSNPCMNGGTCSVLDGSSFTCTCPSSYTGFTCNEEISLTTSFIVTAHSSSPNTEAQTEEMPLTTSAHLLTSFSPTTRLPHTELLTENPGGASSPSAAIAAGSTLAGLLILVVIILSVVLFRRRITGKPVPPDDENEMENYAAVANCYEDKPVGSTPHTPYYLTVVPDSSENGGTAGPVAKQPFPHLQKGGEQKKQPPQVNGSVYWNETHTEEGFVDNVLYGTSDEQPGGLPSLHSTPNDTKPVAHAKRDTTPTSLQTAGRQRVGNDISGIPTADDNMYETYEDGETLIDNVLYNATPSPTSSHRQFNREVDGNEEVYENPDENVYADCEDEETLIDNVLYNSSSPATPRASKHNAVVDQGNGEVYQNPVDNVYEAYEDEGSMVENELYSAAIPPTSRAVKSKTDEESGEVYQNSEFHEVPTNLITNELYKSVDEI